LARAGRLGFALYFPFQQMNDGLGGFRVCCLNNAYRGICALKYIAKRAICTVLHFEKGVV